MGDTERQQFAQARRTRPKAVDRPSSWYGPLPPDFPDRLRADGWHLEQLAGEGTRALKVETPPHHVLATLAVLSQLERGGAWFVAVPMVPKLRGDSDRGSIRVALANLMAALAGMTADTPDARADDVVKALDAGLTSVPMRRGGPSHRRLPRQNAFRGGLPTLGKRR